MNQPNENERFNAVVSGGFAALFNVVKPADRELAGPVWIMDMRESKLKPGRGTHTSMLFQGSNTEAMENATVAEIRERQILMYDREGTLHLVLMGFDTGCSDDLRQEALEEAEESLNNPAVAKWVKGMLYAHKLPESGDMPGAIRLGAGNPEVLALLENFQQHQPTIALVEQAWKFVSCRDKEAFTALMANCGVFWKLVLLTETDKDKNSFSGEASALFETLFKANGDGLLEVKRQALQRLVANIQAL